MPKISGDVAGAQGNGLRVRRPPAWEEYDPLDIACAAALGVAPAQVGPQLLLVQASRGSVVAASAACPLMVMETFRGVLVRVYEPLRPVIEGLVREGMAQGRVLSSANRQHLVEAAMTRLPIVETWHDLLHYTDPAHFIPWREHRVRPIAYGSGRKQRRARGPQEAALGYGIFAGGDLVAYADVIARGDYACSIGVFTEPEFRGRGMGRSLVSAATGAILRAGRISLYSADVSNLASLAVCRSLGYVKFGEDLYCFLAPEQERARREGEEREAARRAADFALHRWVID